jgi:hypothetical protein
LKTIGALVLALGALLVALSQAQAIDGPEIRLVLLIAVDQFRFDYLTRFRTDYTDGFKRLLTDGAVFTNANLEHYPTVTAVGHSTMLTGATPSISGIIGNDWFDRQTGATVTSVSDPTVVLTGSAAGTGASPRRLLVSTVADELRMASPVPKGSTGAPRIFGVSLKDRSAILPAGHGADAAFWWDTKSGRFVSSSYYMPDVPEWVRAFNESRTWKVETGAAWTALSAPRVLLRQLPAERGADFYEAIYGSPFGNNLLLDFTEELLRRELIGTRNVTDLLTVSFSSNDAVGHTYGPDSPQVRDIAVRTDQAIGRLLKKVNETVGLEHTLVALTSDHGVAPLPEWLRAHGMPGGRMTTSELFEPVQQALTSAFGEGKWIAATAGSSPYFDDGLIERLHVDPSEVRRLAAAVVAKVPHVARVYTRDQLLRGAVPNDRIGNRIIRGFNPQRSGDLEIILEPYWIRQAQGATHGTPYSYDAHIPLVLMGGRVKPGTYDESVALNDLAPTLATLIGVETPSGSVGRVLVEALRPVSAEPANKGSRVRARAQ